MSTGLIIDGVFASEAIDSSGEILSIEGADISDLENGLGTLNYEHRGDDAAGASANDIIGKVIFAKKIYGPEDCTDSRQLTYWQKVQLPLIYGIVRLFDGSGHPGAVAAAAIIRDCIKNGEEVRPGFSIEGTTLKRKDNLLQASICRRVALTWKPCNKSAVAGLVSDPLETKKHEHEHPMYSKLSGAVSVDISSIVPESENIRKALEAGNTNAAPGTLTGGAALQREDAGLRNRVKAAVRDWDRKTPFRKFLKHRLPEASDEFVDRFADLVHDYTIKKAQKDAIKGYLVKKIKEKAKPAPKAPAQKAKPAAPKQAPVIQVEPDSRLTIRGKPVEPNPGIDKPHFDENTGVLHTPRGSFPMYIPSRDTETPGAAEKFHNIMRDPNVEKFHDYAMQNWTKVHQHLKNGTLPPEVVMHGVLFSQLSPNTPVPFQEMMYAHLVDSMKATGKDFRSPEGLEQIRRDWLKRDQPLNFPEHSRDHFHRLENALRISSDSDLTGRKKGDIGGFMLANNKFKNMEKYHTLHEPLMELVNRHRHDARSAVEELMFHKKQAGLWNAKRERETAKGRPDIGPYTAGPSVPGLATKTARYTYGMLGGGNVTVPDTHFSRYLFGLDKDQDMESIRYIRDGLLWNANNSHIMGALDRYYGKHHDAVQHMLQHPTWGKHFENPEDAIFPAFWKNWVGIVPHEAARGMKTGGFNEATDHKPFWDAVGPYLKKAEAQGLDMTLAARTAQTHSEWVQKYGEMPALMLYFHYLVPQLLAPSENRLVAKFEQMATELRKDETQAQKPGIPETVQFQGKTVKPGHGYIPGNKKMVFFGATPEHLIGVPREKAHAWTSEDLMKIPRTSGASVQRYPEPLAEPSIVSVDLHGVREYTKHDDVRNLVDGLDFDAQKQGATSGINMDRSFWTTNKGRRVYVKASHDENEFDEPSREALYHNLARDFFGMGKYVAPTGVVLHPRTGQKHAVIENVARGEHVDTENPEHQATLKQLAESGELHKMTVMNVIASNHDRHRGNFMMVPGGMKLIDHGYAFSKDSFYPVPTPDYLKLYHLANGPLKEGEPNLNISKFHPEAAKWVQSLDPVQLEMDLMSHAVPRRYIEEARRRLVAIQREAKNPNATIASVMKAPFSVGDPALDGEPDTPSSTPVRQRLPLKVR
jgi:hypothetical protein